MGNKNGASPGPVDDDDKPLPICVVNGQRHYDVKVMTTKQRVRFLLWRAEKQDDLIGQLRHGLVEAGDLVHIQAAILRRMFSLQMPDGTPVGLDDFFKQMAREHLAYAAAMVPSLTEDMRRTHEARSLSHRIKHATKASRANALRLVAESMRPLDGEMERKT